MSVGSASFGHLWATDVPGALGELRGELEVGEPATVSVLLSSWDPDHFAQVMVGAGFEVDSVTTRDNIISVDAHTIQSLPDTVSSGMALLICGLNPSPASADAGVGFARPGNRFWPAAIASGLVSRDRDPHHALAHHGVGMTDIVKRTTRRADEVSTDEFKLGIARLEGLADWLKPKAICMVGLAGWRAAVDRKAQRGWQDRRPGGCGVYVMPSTSGLNAHDTVETLTEHLRLAQQPS